MLARMTPGALVTLASVALVLAASGLPTASAGPLGHPLVPDPRDLVPMGPNSAPDTEKVKEKVDEHEEDARRLGEDLQEQAWWMKKKLVNLARCYIDEGPVACMTG